MNKAEFLIFALYISTASLQLACATSTAINSANVTSKPAKFTGGAKQQVKLELAVATSVAPIIISPLQVAAAATRRNVSDSQPEASLLRPTFMRGLWGSHKSRRGKQAVEQESEEMEEVTQTIMVPINEVKTRHNQKGGAKLKANESPMGSKHFDVITAPLPSMAAASLVQAHSATGPQAAASLQLSSTEIGGLLNDREAPEFYRERELNGDGVLVGEEPASRTAAASSNPLDPRLGAAASGPFGSHQYMGDFGAPLSPAGSMHAGMGPEASLDQGESAFYRQRLMQAASEEGFGSGFNHRFGQSSFGSGDEIGGGGGGGGGQFDGGSEGSGLMQSPNEFNQVQSHSSGAFNGAGANMMGSYSGTGSGDYSPNSGLLRAGSEGQFGSSFGPGEFNGMGSGGGGGGGMGDFSGGPSSFYGNNARLQAHASYNPYLAAANENGDYANRYGFQQQPGGGMSSFGMDQRGFASHNNHHIMPQRLAHAASNGVRQHGADRLMPLSPVVPLAEDLAGDGMMQPSVLSSNQRDRVMSMGGAGVGVGGGVGGGSGSGSVGQMQQQMANSEQSQNYQSAGPRGQHQVHEALEEDPTDTSAQDETGSSEPSYAASSEAGPNPSGPMEGEAGGTLAASAMSSNRGDPLMGATANAHYGPSFVLNVPPPSGDHRQAASSPNSFNQRELQRQMIEFARVGSAGYLPPNQMNGPDQSNAASRSGLSRKLGKSPEEQGSNGSGGGGGGGGGGDDEEEEEDNSRTQQFLATGVDNPAHAGKYIIDK